MLVGWFVCYREKNWQKSTFGVKDSLEPKAGSWLEPRPEEWRAHPRRSKLAREQPIPKRVQFPSVSGSNKFLRHQKSHRRQGNQQPLDMVLWNAVSPRIPQEADRGKKQFFSKKYHGAVSERRQNRTFSSSPVSGESRWKIASYSGEETGWERRSALELRTDELRGHERERVPWRERSESGEKWDLKSSGARTWRRQRQGPCSFSTVGSWSNREIREKLKI